MKVDGDSAKMFDAVRLDSFDVVNKGELTLADTDNGQVKWKDRTGTEIESTLGPHNIVIITKSRYGRG